MPSDYSSWVPDINLMLAETEVARLRAENEKLSTRVTELEVGEACFTPSGTDELRRLRAENEKLVADRASYMDARHKEWAAKYVELQQQINHLRATALTASEASDLLAWAGVDDRVRGWGWHRPELVAKVHQIAHPESQQGL